MSFAQIFIYLHLSIDFVCNPATGKIVFVFCLNTPLVFWHCSNSLQGEGRNWAMDSALHSWWKTQLFQCWTHQMPSAWPVSANPLSSTHLRRVKWRLYFRPTIVKETTRPDCEFDHSPRSDLHVWSVTMATCWKECFLRLCCVWGLAGHCNLDIIFSQSAKDQCVLI